MSVSKMLTNFVGDTPREVHNTFMSFSWFGYILIFMFKVLYETSARGWIQPTIYIILYINKLVGCFTTTVSLVKESLILLKRIGMNQGQTYVLYNC